jgi:hypothetical protein
MITDGRVSIDDKFRDCTFVVVRVSRVGPIVVVFGGCYFCL